MHPGAVPGVTVFGHRGLSSRAPENTLAAFQLAQASGIGWIEADVDVLGDGTPIILHDATLDRTTSGTGPISSITANDLASIDAGSWFAPEFAAERIPTLAQFVQFLNSSGMRANLEIKACEGGASQTRAQLDAIVTELCGLHSPEQLIVSSFSQISLYLFHLHAPQWPTAVLYENAALYDDWKSVVELCGARAIHPEDRGLTRERVREFRSAGYDVNVWTVNDPARASELVEWGCTGIISDIPDVIADHLDFAVLARVSAIS